MFDRFAAALTVGPALVLVLGACATTPAACTEIGCESEAQITFGTLISGPYDLSALADGETITARCNDPDSMEALDNPPDVTCNASGFTVTGSRADTLRSAFVSVYDEQNDINVYENAEVILGVVEETTPNGPDCPPLCTVRSGSL